MQSLSHLPDDQIDAVISAVTRGCHTHAVAVESEEGRRVVGVAVDLISAHNIADFYSELAIRLERRSGQLPSTGD